MWNCLTIVTNYSLTGRLRIDARLYLMRPFKKKNPFLYEKKKYGSNLTDCSGAFTVFYQTERIQDGKFNFSQGSRFIVLSSSSSDNLLYSQQKNLGEQPGHSHFSVLSLCFIFPL